MRTTRITSVCLLAVSCCVGRGDLVLQEYFGYGPTKVDSGYGAWQDSTTRAWYEGTRNQTFSNAAYQVGANAGTGVLETDNFTSSEMRGVQRTFNTSGLTGEFWLSALVRVRSGTVQNEGLLLSLHDAAYSNLGAAKGHIGIGDAAGDSTLAPMFRASASATPEFGADRSFAEGTADGNTYLLVAKFSVSATDDSVSFWLLKATDTFGWTEASLGTPDLTRTADFGASAKNVWVGQKSAASNFDALRISDASGNTGLREVLTGLNAPSGATVITLR